MASALVASQFSSSSCRFPLERPAKRTGDGEDEEVKVRSADGIRFALPPVADVSSIGQFRIVNFWKFLIT